MIINQINLFYKEKEVSLDTSIMCIIGTINIHTYYIGLMLFHIYERSISKYNKPTNYEYN